MLRYLLILLLALPFADLYLLMEIASTIGFWQTLALVVATGLIGAEIVRREGRFVLEKLETSVTPQEVSRNFIEAAMLVLAGAMLLGPGVITDMLGLLLAFRPVRERLVLKLAQKARQKDSARVELQIF